MTDKTGLSERDICTKFITPAIQRAGWDIYSQVREEFALTRGRVKVRGSVAQRGPVGRADYVLFYRPNLPLAVIEAKDNSHTLGAGMPQALRYAEALDIPFVFSSNGDGFLAHDRTQGDGPVEQTLALDDFPSPEVLWARYNAWKHLSAPAAQIVAQDDHSDASGRAPRYYQRVAINRVVEAIARGQQRILLVMATGTGKTYTAFQIIWRLWKSRAKRRILFLADRNILIDQTRTNDFKPFGSAMTKIQHRQVDKSYEIYLALYQAVSGSEEADNIYRLFSPDFFDLVVVDECHRGSADVDSAWRAVLEYFSSATQIGLTATPKETKTVSSSDYFGEPVYTYSLRQGIEDGFLAPYKVVRIDIDKDLEGWRPAPGQHDKHGRVIPDRVYNREDFDRRLVLEHRTKLVAQKVTEFLRATDPYAKTIVFCEDIEHAERMRQELVNANADLAAENRRYVVRITGDNDEGKAELDSFIDPESRYPVIATTSKLLTTGVDAQTCRLIVLDQRIQSMAEFKQIIGRGTRINEDFQKLYFTILDFKQATALFADPQFDGDPVQVYEPPQGAPPVPPAEGGPDEADGAGVDGDAQRISQLVWMIFLKIFDDREQEYELLEAGYRSPIPERLRWRSWAADDEGITGDELLNFVNNDLFPTLKELQLDPARDRRALIAREAFQDAYNYMKNGTLMRQVINKLNEIDFNRSEDRHLFGDIYEQILRDLQSAGNAGEYYTPRAVTQFVVDMVDPQLGETLLDPACGTGGFLACAVEHLRRQVRTPADEERLQAAIVGVEKKQLPHLLCVTNMLLHNIAVPSQIRRDNTLARPLRDYGPRDRVDVIITNPPFGGMEEDGIEQNFPQKFRTRETADLFLVLIVHLLKDGGRGALVLPDGTLFGEGIKTRVKEQLLDECDLHTIVRLPNGVFNPYTGIKTNLLFFTKGRPTREVWFYEHPYPAGYKSYSKTKPIRIEEFAPEKHWWHSRVENEYAWRVPVEEIRARGYNLDIKTPHQIDQERPDPEHLLASYRSLLAELADVRETLRRELATSLEREA